jgi:hypothetical protein
MTIRPPGESSSVSSCGASVAADSSELQHQRADEWLRNGLVEADRQRPVLVSEGGKTRRHEQMPRHFEHRAADIRIERIRADLLARQVEMHLDNLDHVPAQDREVPFGHRFHRRLRLYIL